MFHHFSDLRSALSKCRSVPSQHSNLGVIGVRVFPGKLQLIIANPESGAAEATRAAVNRCL